MHYICFIIKIENSYTIYKNYEKKLYNLTLNNVIKISHFSKF